MESPWYWERYERTLFKRGDGCKAYIGHFRRDLTASECVAMRPKCLAAWDNVPVVFWAKRPIIALRTICQSGRDPAEFHGQTIN